MEKIGKTKGLWIMVWCVSDIKRGRNYKDIKKRCTGSCKVEVSWLIAVLGQIYDNYYY